MPKSKHRRKTGAKAVVHPGRGKPGKPPGPKSALYMGLDDEQPVTDGLPLFDWADEKSACRDSKRRTRVARR